MQNYKLEREVKDQSSLGEVQKEAKVSIGCSATEEEEEEEEEEKEKEEKKEERSVP